MSDLVRLFVEINDDARYGACKFDLSKECLFIHSSGKSLTSEPILVSFEDKAIVLQIVDFKGLVEA